MASSLEVSKEANLKSNEREDDDDGYTCDGSVDFYGQRANRERTGKWVAGVIILLNQGLATLAFFGVGVNLVLFLTRVLHQNNAEAANSVSKWTGTVYIFSLVGAFLSDSYWGRFKTCAVFQAIFVAGLALFALTTQIFLLKPRGCGGDEASSCVPHSSWEVGLFYVSIYMIALGNGGYQPNIATFGADQFDLENPEEGRSKVAYFSYFYLSLNLGSLFSNTVLGYFEDEGMWALGFWGSTASAFFAVVLFLGGTKWYRHFKPTGNPLSRFCQVIVAATKKCRVETSQDGGNLFDGRGNDESNNGSRKIMHTPGFKFLDRAAVITPRDSDHLKPKSHDPWRLCPISQVEEVKCIMRLIPIWLCTVTYSVVFAQMASLFVEQGDAMNTDVGNFKIPAAAMSAFDILSVAFFIFLYRRVIGPVARKLRKNEPQGLTELERMGLGLAIAVLAMVASGLVEVYRLEHAVKDCSSSHCHGSSSLSVLWQVPQYCLIGASEVFMYVGQLEFFNAQAPEGLKSFGSAMCMTSISLGNYVSSLLVSIVMKVSTEDDRPGWIPGNLNEGRLDRFYFMLAGLTAVDLVVYVLCAMGYRSIRVHGKDDDGNEDRDCCKV